MGLDKKIVSSTIQCLEILLDESTTLTDAEKGELTTLINFWRCFAAFLSE